MAVCVALFWQEDEAFAHGDGSARGLTSTVTSITPPTAGVQARIVGGDDRVELRVLGSEVVIFGYQGEPYLRFGRDGVYRNERSPARFLNEERYGDMPLPAEADARARPLWRKVAAAGRPYEWHDHRIHWMSRNDPPLVVADRDQPHHLFDWVISGTVEGAPLKIAGSADYEPLPAQRFPPVLLIPLALLAVFGIAVWVRRSRIPGRAQDTTSIRPGRPDEAGHR
jgi:hypothetical protein